MLAVAPGIADIASIQPIHGHKKARAFALA